MNVQYINSNTNKCIIEFGIEDMQELLALISDAQTRLKWTGTEQCIAHKWFDMFRKTMFEMFDQKSKTKIIELEKHFLYIKKQSMQE